MNRSLYVATGDVQDTTGIATRVAQISVSAIKQMPMLATKLDGCVSLGQGIPSFNTPLFIREAVAAALMSDETIGKYSLQPGMPPLKTAIVERLQRTKGITNVDPDTDIVVTCGAMEGLAIAISTIVERDDEVILLSPSYSSHIEQVLFAEGVPVFVPMTEGDDWTLDIDRIASAITSKTKAIILCSPANPTGSVFSEAELRAVAKLAIEHNLYVVADETYDFLTYDGRQHFSLTSIPELQPNIIATYSFSKMFCMTGWRVGYMYASKKIVDQVLKVHDAFAICAPAISQFAALTGLRNSNGVDGLGDIAIQEFSSVLASRRDLISARLENVPQLFRPHVPQGAYYAFPKIAPTGVTSMELALRLLNEAKVVTIPGNGFGPTGEGHIRMSFGGTEESINQAMDRIDDWTKTNL